MLPEYKFNSYKESHGRNDAVRLCYGLQINKMCIVLCSKWLLTIERMICLLNERLQNS